MMRYVRPDAGRNADTGAGWQCAACGGEIHYRRQFDTWLHREHPDPYHAVQPTTVAAALEPSESGTVVMA